MDWRRLAHGLRETSSPTAQIGGTGARLRAALLVFVAVASPACAADDAAALETGVGAVSAADASGAPNLDLLFVVENSPGMAPMQAKLVAQIPSMMKVLNGMPSGFPSLHVAVVSTDMGAHSDSPDKTGCLETGDEGAFQAQPLGTCSDTSLFGHTNFLSTGGWTFDDATLAAVTGAVQCVLPLGERGCQYAHPLAAIARALGADGMPAPASNAGFLRPDAMLAIIILSKQDDCSAGSPTLTPLYSLNGPFDNLINSYGPLTTYRCNEFGHLCDYGNNKAVNPPESPTQGQGTPPTLDLANCTSNEGGLLTSVGTFVDEIRGRKADRERQIIVGLIAAPAAPYGVAWVPASDPGAPAGQLWPEVEHSCGPAGGLDTNPKATDLASDGSFGDPSVRLTEFARTFGANGMIGSVCYPDYGATLASVTALIATRLAAFPYLPDPTGSGGTGGGGTTSLDGAAGGDVAADAGAGGLDGSSPTGGGGAAGVTSGPGVDFGGHGGSNGLRAGCFCSVDTPATPGGGFALLLIAPALLRRRSRRARKS